MKNYFTVLTLIASLLIFAGLIQAAGVTTPYWDENPLKLSPGESKTISLTLQNVVGEDNITVRAELIGGSEIATFVDKDLEYFVPLGSTNIPVTLKVDVPEDAKIGEIHEVVVSFKQFSSGEGSTVVIATGFTSKILVEIVSFEESIKRTEPSKTGATWWIWVAIVILIVALIIILSLKKKHKNK